MQSNSTSRLYAHDEDAAYQMLQFASQSVNQSYIEKRRLARYVQETTAYGDAPYLEEIAEKIVQTSHALSIAFDIKRNRRTTNGCIVESLEWQWGASLANAAAAGAAVGVATVGLGYFISGPISMVGYGLQRAFEDKRVFRLDFVDGTYISGSVNGAITSIAEAEALFNQAESMYRAKKFSEAAELFNQAYQKVPARHPQEAIYLARKKDSESEQNKIIERTILAAVHEAELLANDGQALVNQSKGSKDLDQAINLLETAIEKFDAAVNSCPKERSELKNEFDKTRNQIKTELGNKKLLQDAELSARSDAEARVIAERKNRELQSSIAELNRKLVSILAAQKGSSNTRINEIKTLLNEAEQALKTAQGSGVTKVQVESNLKTAAINVLICKELDSDQVQSEDITTLINNIRSCSAEKKCDKMITGILDYRTTTTSSSAAPASFTAHVPRTNSTTQASVQVSTAPTLKGMNSMFAAPAKTLPNAYFSEYTHDGLQNLLQLKLLEKNLHDVVLLKEQYFFTEQSNNVANIFSKLEVNNADIFLIPINLYNKHAVGLIISRQHDTTILKAFYVDPSNQPIPADLAAIFAYHGYDIESLPVEKQRYTNCGPEVLENFILYLTGERLSQEAAIIHNSALLEKKWLSATFFAKPLLISVNSTNSTSLPDVAPI